MSPPYVPEFHLPQDFPLGPYRRIADRVLHGRPAWLREHEFAAAWTALGVRFHTFDRHESALAALLREGAEPADPLSLEPEFLGFFVNGLACLESFAYGLYAIGAILRPDDFPISTPVDRRNALLGGTLRLYSESFPEDGITRSLFWWLNSREFGWWKEVAGILSRRTAPGRNEPPEAGATADGWRLRGEQVHERFAAEKRAWLVGSLAELLQEADAFVQRRIDPLA